MATGYISEVAHTTVTDVPEELTVIEHFLDILGHMNVAERVEWV